VIHEHYIAFCCLRQKNTNQPTNSYLPHFANATVVPYIASEELIA
jgi:hypothetical protein